MTTLHVAPGGADTSEGTEKTPFATVSRAAQLAQPGDTVTVHGGVYREWVRPRRGGVSDTRRITYQAAPGEHVVIKGSEQVTGWVAESGGVWRVAVPSAVFGDWNPYALEVWGDWLVEPKGPAARHLGEVYLNGTAGAEVSSRAELDNPPQRAGVTDRWTRLAADNPAAAPLTWHAEAGEEVTTIWANFGDADPNAELTEISVRRSVFSPERTHLDYITVRGFELAQAACPWTPPTADQLGLIGPNWAKGWIIEDNVIHDAKCSGVSLGKEASTGDNFASHRHDKPGHEYQIEAVFAAAQAGWDAEHIGSHIVRRNTIYDCGQNGIVGHLGCVFSVIEDNHIFRIAIRREFYGHEIAGIKLHAAIDTDIRRNRIHDCTLGTWLDWQAQGTRLSGNVYYSNSRDLFVEVSHGPYLVEHNVFASKVAVESFSQGGAFVHNFIGGTVRVVPVHNRATPYHLPHSTQVKGYSPIYGGDDRWIANIFTGGDIESAYGYDTAGGEHPAAGYGTAAYDGSPTSLDDYISQMEGAQGRIPQVKEPAYIRDNVYAQGASAFEAETSALKLAGDASFAVIDDGDAVYLAAQLPEEFSQSGVGVITGADLPRPRIADADFEEHDGSPVVIDTDLTGQRKISEAGSVYPAGPIANLSPGTSRTRIW